jgi:hypothetical protein
MKSDTFNLKRFLRLLRADLALNAGWILPGAAVFFWAMIVGSFFRGFLTTDTPIAPYFYISMLFFGGIILTSLSFAELGDQKKEHAYLLLPGSAFEKFLSRYILTSWIFMAGILLVYSVFIVIARGVYPLFSDQPFSFSACFDLKLGRTLYYYPLIHPVFFLGAVYFRKQALLKTAVAVIALPIILVCFQILLTRILYHNSVFLPENHFRGFFFPLLASHWDFWIIDARDIPWLLSLWLFPALPPALLIVGYIRFKEREAVDGV